MEFNANRDEALRAKHSAEELMQKSNFRSALRFATKAGKMDGSLSSQISQMVKICEVHCAAETKIENDLDWYGILQVEPTADVGTVKKQYKKLALSLHPDKNKFPGAEEAFKFIGESYSILTDKEKRCEHDLKRSHSTDSSHQNQPPTASSHQNQPPTASAHQNQPATASSHQKQPSTASSHQKQPPTASHQKHPPSSHKKQPPTVYTRANSRKRRRCVFDSSDSDSSSDAKEEKVPDVVILSDEDVTEEKNKQEEDVPIMKEEKKKQEEDVPDLKEESNTQEEDVSNVEGEEKTQEEDLLFYDAPDFSDFDKLREKSCFQADQIWALYDEEDGMPRYYALISEVTPVDFKIQYVWLDVDEENEFVKPNLPVSVGKFEVGSVAETNKVSIFSHLVCFITGRLTRARKFIVFPKKGETWALFKNWDSVSPLKWEYDYVEIFSAGKMGENVSVGFLSKVEGYICVFRPMPKDSSCEILPQEYFRFSHCVPSVRLTGTEDKGVADGWYELDPAALQD